MASVRHLFLDFETRSKVDLKTCGLDVYSSSPTTRVLMLAWALDNEEPNLWVPIRGEPMPERLKALLKDRTVRLVAHNSQFENAIFSRVLKIRLARSRWRDTMIMAHHCGMPGMLGQLCEIVGMKAENAKMKEGHRMIGLFCVPRKTTDKKPWEFNDWNTLPAEWEMFCQYCVSDVKAERDLFHKLLPFDLPDFEWEAWALDQEINERGIPVDRLFVNNAMEMYKFAQHRAVKYLKGLTGLSNPMSTAQMLPWARERGYPYNDMRKTTVVRGLLDGDLTPECREALTIRAENNKASVKKYDAIARRVGADGFLRFVFQFMGAARTGRWAGRAVQPQNFSRPAKAHEKILDQLTDLIRENAFDEIEFEHGEVMSVLSSCVRSSFRAPEGYKLCVSDLSSIEDRMVAWLARCETILAEHRGGLDPYKSFGTHLYMKKYEAITKEERTNSKPGRLGCCYRLSAGEIAKNKNGDVIKTGLWGYAESMGVNLSQEECAKAVAAYRNAYPEVVQFWYDLENAAKATIKTQRPHRVGHLEFDVKAPFLRMKLPSGRYLHYLRPKLERKKFEGKDGKEPYFKEVLSYEGLNQVTRKWERAFTHGGKLCLAEGTLVLTQSGWVPIERVSALDAVWDGEEWVACDGNVCNGLSEVINLSGVLLTRDHEVLTVGGWMRAGDINGAYCASACRSVSGKTVFPSRPLFRRAPLDGCKKQVYDLVNCGPRNRFVVRSEGGLPLIVHNCENATQAAARDVLSFGLLNADKAGFPVVLHAHDEIVALLPEDSPLTHEDLERVMSINPEWCLDLPLGAAGYTGSYYKKE